MAEASATASPAAERTAFSDIFEDIFGRDDGWPSARSSADASRRGPALQHGDFASRRPIPARRRRSACRRRSLRRLHGTGAKPGTRPKTCGTCQGTGRVRAAQGFFSIERTCRPVAAAPDESPTLAQMPRPGPRRGGADALGQHSAGIEDGRASAFREGEAGLRAARAGDLYIFLSVKPHEFYQRDGADLYCAVPISMTTAALAASSTSPRSTVPNRASPCRKARRPASSSASRARHAGAALQPDGRSHIQIQIETPAEAHQAPTRVAAGIRADLVKENNPESTGFFSRMKDFFDTLSD